MGNGNSGAKGSGMGGGKSAGGSNAQKPIPVSKTMGVLELKNGEIINLKDSPLSYGGKDPSMSTKERQAVETFENEHYTAPIEYGTLIGKDGTTYTVKAGKSGSVSVPYQAYTKATTMSHNHPRGSGLLGGTFSMGDLTNFANQKPSTKRATAKEGTYSISRTKSFKKQEFITFAKSVHSKQRATYEAKQQNLNNLFKLKKITEGDYEQKSNRLFNSYLVGMHNDFIAGQEKYGYVYTLEERG